VVAAESEQMVAALKQRGVPVTYITFPDEGHGFVRPENRLAFYGVTEAFLAKHLGGRYQPIGNDFCRFFAQSRNRRRTGSWHFRIAPVSARASKKGFVHHPRNRSAGGYPKYTNGTAITGH
jgi:acetyl esterase/lipase